MQVQLDKAKKETMKAEAQTLLADERTNAAIAERNLAYAETSKAKELLAACQAEKAALEEMLQRTQMKMSDDGAKLLQRILQSEAHASEIEATLQSQREESQCEKAAMSLALDNANAERRGAEQQLSRLESEHSALKALHEEAEGQGQLASAQAADLTALNHEMTRQVETLKRELAEAVRSEHDNFARTRGAEEEAARLSASQQLISTRCEAAERKVEEMRSSRDDAVAQRSSALQQLAVVSSEKLANERGVERLMEQMKEEKADLATRCSAAEASVRELTDERSKVSDQLAVLGVEKREGETRNRQAQEELSQLRVRCEAAEAKLEAEAGGARALKAKMEVAETRGEAAEVRVEAAEVRVEAAEARAADMARQCAESGEERARLSEARRVAEEALRVFEGEERPLLLERIAFAERQLEEAGKQLEKAGKQLEGVREDLAAERQALSEQLAEAKDAHAETRRELASASATLEGARARAEEEAARAAEDVKGVLERLAEAEARGKELEARVDAAHAKHVECMEERCVALQAAEREKAALGLELSRAKEEAAREAGPHALLRDEHRTVLARCEALSADRLRVLDMYSAVVDERNGFQDRLRIGSAERTKNNMRALSRGDPLSCQPTSSYTSPRGYLSARDEAREVTISPKTSPMPSPSASLSSPCVVTARELRVNVPSSSPLKVLKDSKLAVDRAKDAQGIQDMYRRTSLDGAFDTAMNLA